MASISDNPASHVLHDIESPERYVLGGCVEDIWLTISALVESFPEVGSDIAYLGVSFGGGVGALAVAWDLRVRRAHFSLPSFGHQALRLRLPTTGSASSVQQYARQHAEVLERTLAYYDAASAARFIEVPTHLACALFDPAVAPPAQFAVHNALSGPKRLFVLSAGHFDHPGLPEEQRALAAEVMTFFGGERTSGRAT